MNILFKISYKGTNYSGWQIQNNSLSIQEIIERAIFRAVGQKVTLTASGRTDAGVHALVQCANANLSFPKIEKLPLAINPYLPDDIKILSAQEVPKEFNSRFSAKKKTYLYRLQVCKIPNPINFDEVASIEYDLDIKKMQEAAQYIVGTHNFKSFCSTGAQTTDFIRTIYDLEIKQIQNEFQFKLTGNGFLYNMVRIIVGTLVDVGRGKIKPQEVKTILDGQKRINIGKTMPAKGLYLYSVDYEGII